MGVGVQKLGSTWHDWLLVLLLAIISRSPRLPSVCTGDPGEGKCSSSAVPSNVFSRHPLDSVLHNNPVRAFIAIRVSI